MVKVAIGIIALMALLTAVLVSCTDEEVVVDLGKVEVREYEGKLLSSVDDFKENLHLYSKIQY